jgi:uncharacterized protein YjiS (DUF1127 family)
MALTHAENPARLETDGAQRLQLARLVPILRQLLALLTLWHARAQQRRQLVALNDRELRDIGLTRANVAEEFLKPFWRA